MIVLRQSRNLLEYRNYLEYQAMQQVTRHVSLFPIGSLTDGNIHRIMSLNLV